MVETMNPVRQGIEDRPAHQEGKVAKTIEQQTAKLPSDIFLWSALSAIGVSLFLQMSGQRYRGLLLGQLAAPILILGLYNKIVKVAGSDSTDQDFA